MRSNIIGNYSRTNRPWAIDFLINTSVNYQLYERSGCTGPSIFWLSMENFKIGNSDNIILLNLLRAAMWHSRNIWKL